MGSNAAPCFGRTRKDRARHLDFIVFNGLAQQRQILFEIGQSFEHGLFVGPETSTHISGLDAAMRVKSRKPAPARDNLRSALPVLRMESTIA